MAAATYYSSLEADTAYTPQKPGHVSQASNSSLKPFALASPNQHPAEFNDPEHHQLAHGDQKLKKRIRFLRIIQRIVACLISIAALVPIAMTLHKYLTTKDVFLVAPTPTGGTVNRTAWTAQPKTWPTYVFFSTAVVSLTIHLGVLLGYCCSIRTSNILDTVGTWVVSIELSAQLILWIVVSAIYKYQSEKVENGRHNDLWGWTCSGPAQAIQNTFEDVIQFGTFCDIQSAGWYAGLVQIGAIVLALVIMLLAWRRKKSKKAVRRSAIRSLQRGVEGVEGVEGYRHQKV